MSKRNMTEVRVDGYRYTVSIAAKNHIHEVLAAYVSTKKALPVAKARVEEIKVPEPEKKPIFRIKDKKKKR